jgi:leucyl aminopeptidase
MNISLTQAPLGKEENVNLIIGLYENGDLTPTAKQWDEAHGMAISQLIKQSGFEGKSSQTLPFYHSPIANVSFLLVVGLGTKDKITGSSYRKIVVSAIKALPKKIDQISVLLSDVEVGTYGPDWKVKQIVEAFYEATYRFDLFKSKKDPEMALQELIIPLDANTDVKKAEKAVHEGTAIAHGAMLAKNLGNLPSNICTPDFLAEQAQALTNDSSALKITILDEEEMQKLNMGALLAVSQGSAQDAKLICLEYQGGKKDHAPVALIGKGITFDTGGNSLKPADSMVGMKYDMCGAASVLGTIKAIAELKLPVNVVGIIPAVENMPGGTAYKPEDILTSMSGQTIEVISTDAEGRLILADAITYSERYQPEVIIDIATLTGAVVIALGFHATGLLSNDEKLVQDLLKAGIESNDRAWQLPLWEEYQEQIKSPFADMANTGGRSAGTITAACFLSRFAGKQRWAHLDVAGTAAMMMGTAERMATGRPVPLLVQYLIDKAASK